MPRKRYANCTLKAPIRADRLRKPVKRWARAAVPAAWAGKGLAQRKRIEHDARSLDAVGLRVGLGDSRRGGRYVGAARQIAALDLAH